ncbi:MAG: hypothetical protein RIC35_10060 [Marinoscillum sp.]
MRFFRNHIVVRALGLFMAAYVLNFSVDAPDAQTDHVAEDLSINDMESVAEIVLEEWMEIEDAIPEHDESDANDSTMTFKKSFDFFCMEFKKEPAYISDFLSNNGFLAYQKNFYQQFFPEFTPPPPKA